MSEMIVNDAIVIEGLEACFFDDDFVQNDVVRGKESTAGRWTHAEHEMFVKGLEAHSKQWKLIAELIKTRTVVQVRTHAQKYFQKLLKQSKNDGTNINEEAFADMFNESSADLSGGLKRKNSNTFPIKNKVKRTDSMSSMSMETCSNRSSSDGDLQTRTEIEKKRKMKSERPDSPCHRSFADSETEPYLNSYPIQMSTGNSYPQDNLMSEGNSTADWYNLGNTQGQGQALLHGQTQRYQQNMLSSGYSAGPNFCGPDLSHMGYTHGMDCNAHTTQYYQSQSYPPMLPQVNISHCIQQMDFPDPFGIGNADLNGLDLCWLVDDMDMPDSAADVYGSRTAETQQQTPHTQTNFERTSPTTESSSMASKVHGNVAAHAAQESKSSNSECSAETSSAFGSSEAYTSYEESSLTSCTSSDDGCYDDFDASPTQDQTMGDAMAVITNTNSQRRRLSKSSLARNNSNSTTNGANSNGNNGNYYSNETCATSEMQNKEFTTRSTIQPTQPQTQNQNLTNCLSTNSNSDGTGWFRGDDEDLVLGIVEAFSS